MSRYIIFSFEFVIHKQRCRHFVFHAISPKIATLPAICFQDDSSVYLDNFNSNLKTSVCNV
jgi:hypothetical protein